MPRKQHLYHYIYKTTCKVTGRYYIDMHSTSNLEDEYIGSGKRLWLSIRKHGRENHEREILEFLDNRILLRIREKEIVNEDFLRDRMCMNLALGGEGGFINIEAARKGGQRGRSTMTEETRKIFSDNMIHVNKTRDRSNDKFRKYCSNMSEMTRKKIGSANSIQQKGEKNSQFGKAWIYNDKEKTCTRIDAYRLDEMILQGWIRGRKMNYALIKV